MRRLKALSIFVVLPAIALLLVNACSAIETPNYESVEKEGLFEIRRYQDLAVASTPMKGMQEDNQSFRRLFKYISGENRGGEKIAMTAPVIMNEGDQGQMRFVLPSEVAKRGAPRANGENVEVRTLAGGRFAVLTFADGRKEEKRSEAVKQLKTLIDEKGLKAQGEHFFAFYDPPFKPSFLCTFEVWLRLTE